MSDLKTQLQEWAKERSTSAKVIDIDSRRPHRLLQARCKACGCTWGAMYPAYVTDTAKLECPACRAQDSEPLTSANDARDPA